MKKVEHRDYYIRMSVQNGRIRSAMEAAGMSTVSDLARASGERLSSVCNLLNFKLSPKNKKGDWRKVVVGICRTLAVEPSEMFPKHIPAEIPVNFVTGYASLERLLGAGEAPPTPLELCCGSDEAEAIHREMGNLTDMESSSVRMVVEEGLTLREAASRLGVTGPAVRSASERALRKMRSPEALRRIGYGRPAPRTVSPQIAEKIAAYVKKHNM